ncbi:N-acetyltransferase [Bacillus sp. FJAT-49705]|uniref:N-acetyltransferase n=1 Tax=Cytobacillus citreus TaxID=2833586 RepID=A0ABS5NZ37_9BACI|nr:N-acetyltransferase [Cytobacillus citreus]MBS4192861.1 N-acetyltransferase [Cytobacillus citreus]
MNFIIRKEQESDYDSTEKVVKTAFASADHSDQNEHKLVLRIRLSNVFIPELSLVAAGKDNDEILGHILLSKVLIGNGNKKTGSLALAPISVLPDYQNKGIGKSLIQGALQKAKELGFQSVIVLGHPEYYPKFGFRKSSLWQIKAPFDVPEEALMAIELQKGSLDNASGVVEYPSVFFE